MIEHRGECVGRWELTGVISEGLIRCAACGAEHPASPGNTTSAFEDNYLGARLRELAEEGMSLLQNERRTNT